MLTRLHNHTTNHISALLDMICASRYDHWLDFAMQKKICTGCPLKDLN